VIPAVGNEEVRAVCREAVWPIQCDSLADFPNRRGGGPHLGFSVRRRFKLREVNETYTVTASVSHCKLAGIW